MSNSMFDSNVTLEMVRKAEGALENGIYFTVEGALAEEQEKYGRYLRVLVSVWQTKQDIQDGGSPEDIVARGLGVGEPKPDAPREMVRHGRDTGRRLQAWLPRYRPRARRGERRDGAARDSRPTPGSRDSTSWKRCCLKTNLENNLEEMRGSGRS